MDYQKNQDLLFNLIIDKGVLKQDVFSNIILNFKDYNFKRAVDACLAASQKLSETKITDLDEARKFCEDQINKNK